VVFDPSWTGIASAPAAVVSSVTVRRPLSAATLFFCSAIGIGSGLGCNDARGPASNSSARPSAAASASASASASAAASDVSPGPTVREGSTIARAPDDSALFVADEDHSVVRVLALPLEVKAKTVDVHVPGRPAQLIAAGDRLLVSIRDTGQGEGALLVLRRKGADLEEAGRVPLPGDAWGLALSPDAKTALVSSAWTHQLSAVDLGTLKVRWTIDVAREPRGIVILPNEDRAYVSHLTSGVITRVDSLAATAPTVKSVELPAAPLYSPVGVKLPASLGWSAVASPAGDRVFFPRHALGALGPNAWFGIGAVDVLLTATDRPLAPARVAAPAKRFVSWVQFAQWTPGANDVVEPSATLAEPRAAVYRARTNTLLVASEGTDTVYELDARAVDPTLSGHPYRTGSGTDSILRIHAHGAAPSGIALSADETRAYVFCRASYDVVTLQLVDGAGAYQTAPPSSVALAEDGPKALATGRRLFFQADNGFMSGGLACAACHPEGRDDGHVWHEVTFVDGNAKFTNFFAGSDLTILEQRWGEQKREGEGGLGYARQTPMLAGRVGAKGPYGWHAESPDLMARIIAGFGLHRWQSLEKNDSMSNALAGGLLTYLRQGLVAPPRPAHELTEKERRGKAIFESPQAACATCHAPQTEYTDRAPAPLRRLPPLRGYANEENAVFRTPSLLFVGGTPPYLHDGRFDSLDSLIEYNQDRMGKTAQLSAEDKQALVAFLKTL
jgi:cytochrome c peroxidase